jgi:peptidoglycan/xylan/chitin deacetylase (PgdA/CDA1 family)
MMRRLPILTFHAIEEGTSPLAFSPRRFRELLRAIEQHSYQTLPLRDLLTGLARNAPLPACTLVLTFDDGYRSVYDEAFPILRDRRMTATVFLNTGRSPGEGEGRRAAYEGRELLNWEEIREMSAAGIEFGAHTRTHPNLTRLSDAELDLEIRGNLEEIQRATGVAVRSFAYPFGRWDERARRETGRYFDGACSDRLALVARNSDRFALPRVDAYYLRSPRQARLVFSRFLPLYLWVCNGPRTARRRLFPPRDREVSRCASA